MYREIQEQGFWNKDSQFSNSKLEAFTASETELVDIMDILGIAVSELECEMTKNPVAFAQVDTRIWRA